MSGVLHPVGPESAQIYWARRALVFGAATVLAVAVALIISGTSGGLAAQPKPPAASDPVPTAWSSVSSSAMQTAISTPSLVDVSPSTTSSPVACPAKELRPTLTSRQRLAPHQRNTFQLSLINGSDQTCVARVTRGNFELKIYSGRDRIWTTDHCPSVIKSIRRTLDSEHAVAWSLTWDGERSKSNCRSSREALRPGTYIATAQLDGAEPVELRMLLRP
jgi:hypothetical protein